MFRDSPLSYEASFGETVERVLLSARANENVDGVLLNTVLWITMSTKVLDGVVDVHETNEALHTSRKYDWNATKC